MSDWPADIDPSPATEAKQTDQPQFTLRSLLWTIAGVGVLVVIAKQLGVGWAIFATVLLGLAWFGGSTKFAARLKRLVAAAAIFAIVAVLIGGMGDARGPALRANCQSNMRMVASAILMYQAQNGHLPPPYVADENGKALCSWRVLILPFLARKDIHDLWKFDEPWDSPHNSKLQQHIDLFRCPADKPGDRRPLTNYVVVVGPGTAWEEDTKLNTASFRDGAAKTLLLVEIAHTDIHWAEPRDLYVGQMVDMINPLHGQGISSDHLFDKKPAGAMVAFADGHSHFLQTDTTPNVLKAFLTRNGGETVNPGDFEP
jgi:prepilin-type processing-associated H-X9-DG protein